MIPLPQPLARSAAQAETIILSAISTAQDDGRPQLAEMIASLDYEIERSKESTRAWLIAGGFDCASPEWARRMVVFAALKKFLMLVAANERAVAAVLRSHPKGKSDERDQE